VRVEANLAGPRRQENEDNLEYVCICGRMNIILGGKLLDKILTVNLDDPKIDGYWKNVVEDLEMSGVGDTWLDHRFR